MNRRVLLSGLGASVLVGCAPSAPPPAADGFVSLAPDLTETVAALGALGRLVGRSDWCHFPPEVRSLPALGSGLTPDLERIAALRPAAILVDGSRGVHLETLQGLGKVEVFPWLSADEVVASVRRLGALVDQPAAAEALALRYAALATPPPAAGPVALMVLAAEAADVREVWYVKRNSLHGAALHAAGGRNAIDHDVDGAPVLSLEGLIALDPPAILVLTERVVDDALRASVAAAWARFDVLTAVRGGRLRVVGGPQALSSGPSIFGLLATLQAELAPLR